MLYFAYGSNLLPQRLQARTPGAIYEGQLAIEGFSLRFDKLGSDGSAKCNAVHTGKSTDMIFGALYQLGPGEREILDEIEGVGRGYEVLELPLPGRRRDMAFMYMAQAEYVRKNILPFCWYRKLVLAGAIYHGFSDEYIRKISRVRSRKDPDSQRRLQNEVLLKSSEVISGSPFPRQ